MYKFLIFFCLIFPLNGNDNLPTPTPKEDVIISGATIHPITSESFLGDLYITKGKISRLVKKSDSSKSKIVKPVKIINCEGLHVYPGMIASNSVLGLTEIRAVRATRDMIETGVINPNVRAEVAVNPDSELFPVTRSNGVLHALSVPQSNGLIAGRSALMSLDGWTWEDMVLKSSVGMHIRWPLVPDAEKATNSKQKEDLQKRSKNALTQLKKIKDSFLKARAYHKAREDKKVPDKTDLRWEAMKPVLDGRMPVFVHVNKISGIRRAVQFSVQENIKIVIVGGSDAWRAVPLLKKNDIPVIVSPVNSLPSRRWEDYDTPMRNPLKLLNGGVRFCIAGPGGSMDAPHERNLPYQAARAAAFGLPKDEALKAVTLYPAQILGVSDRVGSLEVGKDASLIVTNGDPLEVTTDVRMAYIQGSSIDLSNKQTRLYEKYKEKYRQLNLKKSD